MSAQIDCDNCHGGLDCGESVYCLQCRDKWLAEIEDLKKELDRVRGYLKEAEAEVTSLK